MGMMFILSIWFGKFDADDGNSVSNVKQTSHFLNCTYLSGDERQESVQQSSQNVRAAVCIGVGASGRRHASSSSLIKC